MDRMHDVIVIGGGAAGLFCALTAAKRGRDVLVLEHSRDAGAKIRISGGGRCNFTNLRVDADNFVSENPHFCKSALARFTPDDFIALVKAHGICFYEKEKGQLFCADRADKIIAMLLRECSEAGAVIRTEIDVLSVEKEDVFRIGTDGGSYRSRALVIATGGLSLPEIGASDFGFQVARQFGIGIVQPSPALVPFILHGDELEFVKNLSGVSFEAVVSNEMAAFKGKALLTHRGISGPAILQLSLYHRPKESIVLNLLPEDFPEEEMSDFQNQKTELATFLSRYLPARFAKAWCDAFCRSKPLNRYSPKELRAIFHDLRHWNLHPAGTEGWRSAEVTAGGISTAELSSRTMECRVVGGLYFIGEVVDVTGQLGGYNFHWAWASGYAAGMVV